MSENRLSFLGKYLSYGFAVIGVWFLLSGLAYLGNSKFVTLELSTGIAILTAGVGGVLIVLSILTYYRFYIENSEKEELLNAPD